MSPVANTLSSVSLFLSLATLKLWCDRRHKMSMTFRAAAGKADAGSR
ncbi:MAG: hypothetical protein ABI806_15295 [Candidatus Solibacter sp.]